MKKLVDTVLAYFNWGIVLSKMTLRLHTDASQHKRLLMVSWSFPPHFQAGTNRPTYFARYTPDDWLIDVVSAPPPQIISEGGMHLLSTLPEKVKVYRVNHERNPSYRLFPNVDGGLFNAHAMVLQAYAACKHSHPTVVLATGPRFANFVAAWYLAKIFNAKLVLDYRDEWTAVNRPFVQSTSYDRSWERRCLELADKIIFVSGEMLNIYLEGFPELPMRKCSIIENGWDPDDFEKAELCPDPSIDKHKLSISFVGRIGLHNNPSDFIMTLHKVLKRRSDLEGLLKIYFLGKIYHSVVEEIHWFQKEHPDTVEVRGEVHKYDALKFMTQSSILLLINNSMEDSANFVGQKLYEYMATYRPILVYGTGGFQAEIVKQYNAGLVVKSGSSTALEAAIDKIKNEDVSTWLSKERKDWLNSHTRQYQAEELFALLNTLVT